MSYLADRIFRSPRYVQFEDSEIEQSYFDTEAKIVYVVREDSVKMDENIIREIPKGSPDYKWKHGIYKNMMKKLK